jgi:hypothetical protein
MVYDPATDFLGLWRNSGGNVSKLEMPGLDYVLAALARAGAITLSVSATAPVANQSTTAWLQTAVPSYSAEGAFFLWDADATAYAAATPALFEDYLRACAVRSGVDWWTTTGGAPLNTVGHNGDYAIRTDTPNGIYGPKAAGAWPADPIPGTADVVTSEALDNTFGNGVGSLITRGATEWAGLPVGFDGDLLTVAAGLPVWVTLSILMDAVFSNVQGSVLFRNAAGWSDLPPGVANEVLASGGPGADPVWAPRTAEFVAGTSMVFHQAAAPVGWTQQVALNDYGLRVVNGAGGGNTPGSAFSTVFAQATVGGHVLTIAEMPAHNHPTDGVILSGSASDVTPGSVQGAQAGAVTSNTGGGGSHNHTVNLTLAYTDVIIATKD